MNLEQAPSFCLSRLDDDSEVCLEKYRGKAVLLSFWVTWCPACQEDLPQKEVFARSIDDSSFAFFTVNVTGREADPSKVPEFIRYHNYQFPVLLDDGKRTYDSFQIPSVPYSILINPEGYIVGRYDEHSPFIRIVEDIGRTLG